VSIRRALIILLALFACCAAGASSVAAQPRTDHAPTPPALHDTTVMHPMVFYHAHGSNDACGPGCSEWIAAEGKIDLGSPAGLLRLLVQLKGARLPIFFHSPGGRVTISMELGRLIRARQLTVSVSHTIPLGCTPGSTGENSCDAKIRAGQRIEADLDPFTAMCNSACVYAMMGGAVRLIPPGVALGVHDMGVDPSVRRRLSVQVIETSEQLAKARLHNYVHLMGIDDRLLDKAFAVPFTSVERLSRDDAVRLGLDRRDFSETVWRFIDKPAPAIRKDFFVHTRNEEARYIDGVVYLSCGKWPGSQYVLIFGRKLLHSDLSALPPQPPVSIRLSDKQFSFSRRQDPNFYFRSTLLAPTALDAVADGATIVLPGTEFRREEGPAGDITLTMVGFSAAYSKLQKACAQVATSAMPAVQFLEGASPTAPIGSNPFGARPPDGKKPDSARQPDAAEGDVRP
jgi:hypothetical protein